MSIMGRFAKLDSALQRGLDNGFAFVFGGRVVPAEIEELLKQEAEDHLSVTEDKRLVAPNVYVVGVSSRDLENLSGDNAELPSGFADQMSRYCRNQGWLLTGPVIVRVAEESGLRTGQLRVSSYEDPSPTDDSGFDAISHGDQPGDQPSDRDDREPSPPPPPPVAAPVPQARPAPPLPESDAPPTEIAPAPDSQEETMNAQPADAEREPIVSLLLQDGSSRTYRVREGSNIIGRSNDADLRLPDTGVSRQHAEITWDGHDAVLVDLQSTNGTTVNDTPIENWLLADGDVITMGHSHIEVRIVEPSPR
ncbi:DUF3662 and FHA domain-containing protein [Corynebacterium halotolerans]|uniref:FHA domain-containing protein n=1 Tax=Corynebacterium halotolerans YIM 70093 = DSM 44683 TaxID=1121362 RepID=M1NI25_9CORY|nr:DUF3662 and FHA domain-containing protein [Corynebacterium halotolerans]AGF71043.1 hypothetical protein A605_00125 [Corynebacterium halotolerans YIM 70093 = DSM 44683]